MDGKCQPENVRPGSPRRAHLVTEMPDIHSPRMTSPGQVGTCGQRSLGQAGDEEPESQCKLEASEEQPWAVGIKNLG